MCGSASSWMSKPHAPFAKLRLAPRGPCWSAPRRALALSRNGSRRTAAFPTVAITAVGAANGAGSLPKLGARFRISGLAVMRFADRREAAADGSRTLFRWVALRTGPMSLVVRGTPCTPVRCEDPFWGSEALPMSLVARATPCNAGAMRRSLPGSRAC